MSETSEQEGEKPAPPAVESAAVEPVAEKPAERPERVRHYREPKRGARRNLIGTVVSTKMAKTITVVVTRTEMHRKYKKYVRRHSKVYAHDPKSLARDGDMVRVIECRPMSKLKRFYLAGIVRKSTRGQQ